jgi:hypothetical protein
MSNSSIPCAAMQRETKSSAANELPSAPTAASAIVHVRNRRVVVIARKDVIAKAGPERAGSCSQSTDAPDRFTAFPQRSISDLTNLPSSSGVVGAASAPRAASCATMSGAASALCTAEFSRATAGAGVPAGTIRASQAVTSKPGTPDSAMDAGVAQAGEVKSGQVHVRLSRQRHHLALGRRDPESASRFTSPTAAAQAPSPISSVGRST